MRVGVVVPNQRATVQRVTSDLAAVEQLGFDSAWMPGIPNGPDVLTLLGPELVRMPHASSSDQPVLPTYLRHPVVLASQALTVNDALCGRLTLGIGVSHRSVMEGLLGVDGSRPVQHMEEYLRILVPLLQEQRVDFGGTVLRTRYRLEASHSDVRGRRCSSPRSARACSNWPARSPTGRPPGWSDRTRWPSGPSRPCGKPPNAPAGRATRVLASLPFLLTADPDASRDRAGEEFAVYGRLPAYHAVLQRQGMDTPAAIAVIGDEAALTSEVRRVRDAGVTDLQITPFGDEHERRRTLEFMATLP